MKKAPFIVIWFTFLMLVLFMVSCKSKTTLLQNEVKTEKQSSTNQLTTASVTNDRSLAINDKLNLGVPNFKTGSKDKDCDSLCNARKDEWLKEMNFQKQSGNNEYEFYYDELTNQIKLNIKIGETVNTLRDSLKLREKELKEFKQQKIEIPVKLPLTPVEKFFFYSGIGLWCLAIIILLVKLYLKRKNLTKN